MSEELKTNTVELIEPEAKPEKDISLPSRTELKDKGWSAKELEAAEKRGMIQPKEEPKKEEKEEVKAPDLKIEEKQPEKVEEKKPEEKKSTLPDFTISDPAKEKVFLDTFGPGTPQRAMYFRMKNERQARQAAVAELEKIKLENQLIKDQLEAAKNGKPEVQTDENGNVIDPEDRPLTLRQIKEMQAKEAEERERQSREQNERASRVSEAIQTQEEYARSIYPDFDDTVKLAADLMKNLDSVIPEKWKQNKAIKLVKDLQIAAASADKYEVDDYNAALISYELGSLHPNFGKQPNGNHAEENGNNPRPEEKANGSQLTPEQMKRIEANTQRRVSSASIPGGTGRRVVSVDDVTIKDVLNMTAEQRNAFRQKYPEKMRQLLRG